MPQTLQALDLVGLCAVVVSHVPAIRTVSAADGEGEEMSGVIVCMLILCAILIAMLVSKRK